MESITASNSVSFFREAAPYIHSHRGKTFVIAFAGEVIASSQFRQIIQDIAIISTLGTRIVLVHGTRPQIDILYTYTKASALPTQIPC